MRTSTWISMLPGAVLCAAWTAGCTPQVPSPTADLPSLEGLSPDPERIPHPPHAPPDQISVSRILVVHKRAANLQVKTKFDRGQARERAEALLRLARAKGQDFAELARRFPGDSATTKYGGDLGVVDPGQLHPDLEAAALALGLGQVSEVVETPEGFNILLRHEPSEAQAGEIVVSFDGAQRYQPRISRSRDEAKHLAEEILTRLKEGASFEEEALAHSDAPSYQIGGFVAPFRKGTQHPQFEQVVWNLPVGGLSGPIETTTGFHIVQRFPVHRLVVRRILINYRDEDTGEGWMLHSRERARTAAEEARRRALQPGVDFTALAGELSDSGAKSQSDQMEPFGRGQVPYPLERAAFGLKVGEISGVVDIGNGFVVLKRIR